MRRLRTFIGALIVFAVLGPLTPYLEASEAERRHPRPRQNREREYRQRDRDRDHRQDRGREYRQRDRDHRQHREYRPYRPRYHYRSPYARYRDYHRSQQYLYNCPVWIPGYWVHDYEREWRVPGRYIWVRCR